MFGWKIQKKDGMLLIPDWGNCTVSQLQYAGKNSKRNRVQKSSDVIHSITTNYY